ncbi:hypothetical protein K435DRAFT_869109 [Dendrothele bispora CBS 962.96]|uniref:Uncharacterized protein n=1 Tax=Dendrothele bispora (strain CBS 962.96) TaxID=1314807 RepID=A0A4S8L9Y2_DENBC|nr:hypothetical protein K435DRAFT_869109 [Dendrothele bispora CBS 962.96]
MVDMRRIRDFAVAVHGGLRSQTAIIELVVKLLDAVEVILEHAETLLNWQGRYTFAHLRRKMVDLRRIRDFAVVVNGGLRSLTAIIELVVKLLDAVEVVLEHAETLLNWQGRQAEYNRHIRSDGSDEENNERNEENSDENNEGNEEDYEDDGDEGGHGHGHGHGDGEGEV